MIIIQMSGGLGNQMFQYAFYKKLCAMGRRAFFDDVTAYREEKGVVRKILLPVFGIDYPRADPEEVTRLRDADLSFTSRVRRKLFGRKTREVRDEDFVYDGTLLDLDEVYLTGCFQSPRYFEDIEEEIKEAFTFPSGIQKESGKTKEAFKRITEAGRNTCSIHLRFGDYLAKADTYGGICTDAYYSAAVDRVLKAHPDTLFFVFSNDAALAEKWIEGQNERYRVKKGRGKAPESAETAPGQSGEEGTRFVLIAGNDEDHGYRDMYLMSLTHDHVIANSSFSWWGAYLGKKKDGIVIAPSIWIHEKDGSELKREDIYTKDMVRISPRGEEAGEILFKEPGNTPLVSVITACYNIAPYAERAITSLLSQTLHNLEIIAVDDGSTDETGRILDELALRDGRIRVIHKENGGLSDCRNAGLEIARGDYIGFLDGDDYADPRLFETMAKGCILTGSGMAAVRYREVREEKEDEGGRVQERKKEAGDILPGEKAFFTSPDALLKDSILMTKKRALDTWITTNIRGTEQRVCISNSVWSKLFRRDTCQGILFDKGKNSEDILYTTRTMLRAESVLYIPEPLYNYVQDRQGSIMNEKAGERRTKDEIPAWKEQIRLLEEAGYPGLADKAEYTLYRRLLYYITDMQGSPSLAPYREQMEEMIKKNRNRVISLAANPGFGTRGDRDRLILYAENPDAYWRIAGLYAKIRRAGT